MNASPPRPASAPRSVSHSLRVFLVVVLAIALGALLPAAAEARPSSARVTGVSLSADRIPGHLVVKWRAVRAAAYHVRSATSRGSLSKSRIVVSRNHRRTDLGPVTASAHYVQVRAVKAGGRRGPWSTATRVKLPASVLVAPALSVSAVAGEGNATLRWTFKPGSNGEVPTGVLVGRDGVDAASGSGPWSTTDPIGTLTAGSYSGTRVFDNLVKGSAYKLDVAVQGLSTPLAKTVSVTPTGGVTTTPPPVTVPTLPTVPTGDGRTFVDEFDGTALDTSKWVREDFGYGYGSLEKFEGDADLTSQANGQLLVSAIKDQVGPRPWRAGYLSSRGKFAMKTGTVEVRAKLPTEQGAWPAIWLHNRIGASGEPGSALAEIDIMELFPGGGVQGAGSYFTVHDWKNGNKGTEMRPHTGAMDGGWHVWKVTWDANQMQLWIDGVSQGIITPASFATLSKGGDYSVFVNTAQYLIFDMAVGTSWGGLEPLAGTKRMDMAVDYIRVTKTS